VLTILLPLAAEILVATLASNHQTADRPDLRFTRLVNQIALTPSMAQTVRSLALPCSGPWQGRDRPPTTTSTDARSCRHTAKR
jgi:hypothetical protein